jgi:hypothetical protein
MGSGGQRIVTLVNNYEQKQQQFLGREDYCANKRLYGSSMHTNPHPWAPAAPGELWFGRPDGGYPSDDQPAGKEHSVKKIMILLAILSLIGVGAVVLKGRGAAPVR